MDMTLTERNIVLVAHILAAIMTIGPVTVATGIFPRAALEGESAVAASMHRITRRYGAGTLLVPVLGLYLALRMDYMSALWVNLSLGLMLVSLVLLFLAVIPGQQRLVERLADTTTSLAAGDVSTLRMTTGLYGLVWLVILYLMVAKPM